MAGISLHEPEFDALDEELVLSALRSSWVSTGGPFVDQFEREFAVFTGTESAISTANGTIAIQLMIHVLAKRLGIDGSFEVLIPTLTFIATANAVVHAGGHPTFIDCAPGSANVGAASVDAAVRKHYRFDAAKGLWFGTKTGRPLLAVMPVHIMGWPCPMVELATLCRDLQVPLIEDAAEALGTFLPGGAHVGSTSLAAAFSFNGNKILTTGGGGMIVTNDRAFAQMAKHLSTTAKTDALRFVHDEVAFNFRMINILASLGCSQLRRLKAKLARKAVISALYESRLAKVGIKLFQVDGCQANNWLVTAVFPSFETREAALRALNEQQIHARPLWTPVHRQPAFYQLVDPEETFPAADSFWRTSLSLPSSPQLHDAEVDLVCDVIQTAMGKVTP